jgi:ribose transport system ATP-binding protein
VTGRTTATGARRQDAAPPAAVEISELSKTFGRQRALDAVSVSFAPGAISALLGQNGSGKSTLIKILAGVYEPDAGGEVRIWGEAVGLPLNPKVARERGLHFVHQDLGLVQDMTIAENVGITNGFGPRRLGRIRWGGLRRDTEALLERFGLSVDARRLVSTLSAAEQTQLAIARAFAESASDDVAGARRILVLDEPTAALPREEVEMLFTAVRRAREANACVLYVTHRLDEVFELADRVVVLRDGRVAIDRPLAGMSQSAIIEAIVGEELEALQRAELSEPADDVILQLEGLSARRLGDVSLEVREGEVVGIAGLRGSGRSELARVVAGAQRPTGGGLAIGGRRVGSYGPRQALRRGIAYVPEERRRLGAIGAMSVRENVTLPRTRDYFRGGVFRHRAERRDVTTWISALGVMPRAPEMQLGKLSGGNQQKSILAKWFRVGPRLLVLDEPTQGIDVGAKAEILGLIKDKAQDGTSTLLISSEFSELAAVCHRVVVLRDGRVAGELRDSDCTAERITRLCYEAPGATAA